MSSFKRAVKPTTTPVSSIQQETTFSSSPAPVREVTITGVKPWVSSGLGIVSSGNKQLDDLIGGGSALGTFTLIESDCFSNYGETLLLYNLAEAASHQQPILLLAEDSVEAERLISALPYNQTVGSAGANEVAVTETPAEGDNKLTIAWQYSKYLKPAGNESGVRSSSSASAAADGEATAAGYCSSYDLSRRLQASLLSRARIELCLTDEIFATQETGIHSEPAADRCFASIAQAVRAFVSTHSSKAAKTVCRVVIAGLEQIISHIASSTGRPVSSRSAAKFVLQLKHIIRAHRVSLTMTMNTSAVAVETAVRVRQIADTLLSVESFAGCAHSVPYEFKEFQGFLVVHKIQHYGSIAPFRPPGTRFGLKRDRRKLHIEPLHLPPEESRAFSTTGGAAPVASSTAGAASTAAAGKPADESAAESHAHTHSHEHVHHADTLPTPPPVATKSAAPASTAAAGIEAAVPLTPLQASLAALKAARQAAASSGSTSLSAPAFAPISIQRAPVAAATSAAPNKSVGSVGSVGSVSSASGYGSGSGGGGGDSVGKTPPLQPGQACGAQLRPGQSSNSQYDF